MSDQVKVKLGKQNIILGGKIYQGNKEHDFDPFAADQLVNQSLGELVKAEAAPAADAPKGSSDRTYCHVEDCKKYSKLMLCPECEKLACPEHVDNEAGMCVTCVAATEADD